MQACDRCHARKTRCDRRIPQCSACEKARAPCLHADKLRQRNVPRGYIDSMENMVKQLKEENQRLRRSLASQSSPNENIRIPAMPTPASFASPDDPNSIQAQHATTQSIGGAETSPVVSCFPEASPPSGASYTPASSKGSPTDDLLAQEVGYLSLIAAGETRYLGSSSGLGLASVLGSVFDTQDVMSFLSLEQGVSSGSEARPLNTVPLDTTFPSLAVAAPLIEAYFQHAHITFPLLHRPSFMTTVERIYTEPGYYHENTVDAFIFDMVLAIGGSNFNRFDESTTGASRYYAMAQAKLGSVMAMDRLTALRAILLISQHGIFSNLRDTSASTWHLIGIGARLCFELGLHVEPRRVREPGSVGIVSLDEEMKRRCFWCLYNLDRVVSCTLGRPVIIRDEEIGAPLPSHLDDDNFGPDHPIDLDGYTNDSSTKRTSPFLHLIRIRRISGQILHLFYNSRQISGVTLEERRSNRRRFRDEINAWKDETKHLPLCVNTDDGNHVSSFLTPEWYNAVYSNAILLLYRPSPNLPNPTFDADSANGESSLMILMKAAEESIRSYSELHRERRLNYSFITLHAVFIAGLAYIYSVGRILRDSTMRQLIPDFLSVVELTRTCSNILVAICERWSISRRSCELFNRLSDALIRDTLNVTKQDQAETLRDWNAPLKSSESLSPQSRSPWSTQTSEKIRFPHTPPELGSLEPMPELGDILVMDEFRQLSGSVEFPSHGEGSFPSELVAGFSQDWPFDVPVTSKEGLDSSMQAIPLTW